MAVTAAIALSAAAIKAGQTSRATLTVTNGGAADVLVTGIQPTVSPATAPLSLGQAPWGAAFPQTVAASGSTDFPFDAAPYAPTADGGVAEPASRAYTIGATVLINDGSTVYASTATLTVTPPTVFPS